ncbi:DoxX family protein [Corynebacterium lizhenjunii]|uniref:DoxX family protein n=1 Tax=Corynebacterium lizhenjunii TaxID=2709394 RepID=A0A7T0KF81_9CORY|nr:DoxX family protein [Corynebacterium lizhenjunii]QPK79439.1 DoxX family protein [Corynebacterium lizhenjunii]
MNLTNSFVMLAARVILGVVLIAHGWQKVSVWGIAGTTESFANMGVPAASIAAPAAAGIEIIGGILIIVGLGTRIVGALVAVTMVFAGIFAGHFTNGIYASNGGWELVGIIATAALMLVAAGPGMHSVDHFLRKNRQQA